MMIMTSLVTMIIMMSLITIQGVELSIDPPQPVLDGISVVDEVGDVFADCLIKWRLDPRSTGIAGMAAPPGPGLGVRRGLPGLAVIFIVETELLRVVHMEQLAVQGSPIEAPDRSLGVPDSLHVDEAVVRDDDDINDPAEPGEHRPQLPGLDTASDVGHIHGVKLHG